MKKALLLTILLTACGTNNPLEGAWLEDDTEFPFSLSFVDNTFKLGITIETDDGIKSMVDSGTFVDNDHELTLSVTHTSCFFAYIIGWSLLEYEFLYKITDDDKLRINSMYFSRVGQDPVDTATTIGCWLPDRNGDPAFEPGEIRELP